MTSSMRQTKTYSDPYKEAIALAKTVIWTKLDAQGNEIECDFDGHPIDAECGSFCKVAKASDLPKIDE